MLCYAKFWADCQTAAVFRFFDFSRWRPFCLPSWIFESRQSSEGQCASPATFLADQSNRFRDTAIFRFLVAAVRHIGLVLRDFGPPTKSIRWSLPLCQIWLRCFEAPIDSEAQSDNVLWGHLIWRPQYALHSVGCLSPMASLGCYVYLPPVLQCILYRPP